MPNDLIRDDVVIKLAIRGKKVRLRLASASTRYAAAMTRREIASPRRRCARGASGRERCVVAPEARPAPSAKADPSAPDRRRDDIESLRAANAKLVESLHDADKTIAQLREQLRRLRRLSRGSIGGGDRATGARRRSWPSRRGRGEPTAEDWERMAQVGTVRVRVPCMRDKPWTPNQRVLDRLGLAPGDASDHPRRVRELEQADGGADPAAVREGARQRGGRRPRGPEGVLGRHPRGREANRSRGHAEVARHVSQRSTRARHVKPPQDGAAVEQLLLWR